MELVRPAGVRHTEVVQFVADATVVRLARWMRLLGHDVEVDVDPGIVRRRVLFEGRIALSRNGRLIAELSGEGGGGFLVRPNRTSDQLREVVSRFGVPAGGVLARCSRCNEALEEVTAAELEGRVWPHVLREHHRFRRCPTCKRVYWRGGHVERMRAFLDRAGVIWETATEERREADFPGP